MHVQSHLWQPVIASTVIQQTDGIATDSCFRLIGPHQCGVLMAIVGRLAASVSTPGRTLVVSTEAGISLHMTVRDCALYGIERTVMLMTDNLYLLRSPWPFIELDRLAYYPMIIATHHLTLTLGYSVIIPIPTASHCYNWLQGIPPNAGKYIMHHLHPESVLSVMTQTCKYLCTMSSLYGVDNN